MNRNKAIRSELDQLLREGLLDDATYRRLSALYPVGLWDWRSLGRWFLIFGAISCAAGGVILLRDVFTFTLEKLAWGLALSTGGLFAGGWKLRQRSWSWSGQAVELLGGLTLIGLSFTLGIIFSSGSGNWPALLLIDLIALLALSYARHNILLLILSAVVFFTWFGGVTGYRSGWGAYWFGMNYPLRFLGAGLFIAMVGVAHLNAEQGPLAAWRGFSKAWISSGLFFSEMALWLLSIFGNFASIYGWHDASAAELLLFNAVWAGANGGLIVAGSRFSYRMLRGYGGTFLIIQIYTLFFTRIAEHIGFFASLFIAGGSALALVFVLESKRREARRERGGVQE
ncbi:MAG: hypothetical protein FWC58_05545 [Desulfobulbus sp.]|nr:hypothetical protein [Desulfobulbus sp.]